MASGGVENETLDSDICNCTICLETFKVPKILPCFHTFCQTCLNTYILSTKGEKSPQQGHFLCPLCRTEVTVPDPKAPVEEWAKLMPLNNIISPLIEGSSIDQAENEKKCDPCGRHEESTPALFWCFECQDNLCEFCQKCHKRVKSAAGHKIVPVHELKKEDLGIKISDTEEPCVEHTGEFLKVYCADHQKMCCVLCLSIDHRKCENIKTFDQMSDIMKDEPQNLAKTMKTFCQRMDELIVKKEENIDGLGQHKQDILEGVAKMVEKAKEKLDKCHEDFKIHLSQTHKEQTTKLVETKERFEILQKSIENCEKVLQAVLKHGSPKQIFITSQKIKTRLQVQLKEFQEMLHNNENIAYYINNDKYLTEMNSSMKSVAELQLRKTVCKESLQSLSIVDSLFQDILLQCQLKTASIDDLEAMQLWDMKGDGKYKDAIFLNNNDTLLCTDNTNKVLMMYDNEGKLLFSHSVDYKPWGVAQTSDGKIFVSDTTSPGIRIYTLENQTLQQISFIATTEKPYAVGVMQDNIVVVINGSISLFNPDGTQGIKIGNCNEFSFVAVSKNNMHCIYCCDGDYVVQYTADGKEVMRHQLKNVKSARGIAVDNTGNIYVCGRDSRNVIILSKDGTSKRVFFSSGDIVQPYSIGFDHTGTRFFLTGHQSGAVVVFRLSLKNSKI